MDRPRHLTARAVTDSLVGSEEPSVRYLVRRDVLGDDPDSRAMRGLADEIRRSPRVAALLDGHGRRGASTYGKWQGAHWVTLALVELAHPGGDRRVAALVDETLDHWTAQRFLRDREVTPWQASGAYVPIIAGRARRCASQHGAALLIAAHFGGVDDRARLIEQRLADWQWPDGGWNCDRRTEASMSSVNETLLPLRGLAAVSGSSAAPVRAAREFLLERRVAFRRTDSRPLHPNVMDLHFPPYWHYDLLAGLDGLAQSGGLADERCERALDLLEARRRADGWWSADARWYRVADTGSNVESVDWGPTGASRRNVWVTVRALAVLRAAGREPGGFGTISRGRA